MLFYLSSLLARDLLSPKANRLFRRKLLCSARTVFRLDCGLIPPLHVDRGPCGSGRCRQRAHSACDQSRARFLRRNARRCAQDAAWRVQILSSTDSSGFAGRCMQRTGISGLLTGHPLDTGGYPYSRLALRSRQTADNSPNPRPLPPTTLKFPPKSRPATLAAQSKSAFRHSRQQEEMPRRRSGTTATPDIRSSASSGKKASVHYAVQFLRVFFQKLTFFLAGVWAVQGRRASLSELALVLGRRSRSRLTLSFLSADISDGTPRLRSEPRLFTSSSNSYSDTNPRRSSASP